MLQRVYRITDRPIQCRTLSVIS